MVETELLTLGALVVAGALGMAAARAVQAPPVAAFIVAGFLLSLLAPAVTGPFLTQVLFVSLAFLLFDAGVRVNPGRFTRAGLPPGIRFGLLGGTLTGLVGAGAALLAGWGAEAALYVAAAVGPSSTLLVLDALALRGEMVFPHGRLLVQGLLVQDLVMIALFATLPYLPGAPRLAVLALVGAVILAGLAVGVSYAAKSPRLWALAPDAEVRNLLAFALLFAFILIADALGIPTPAAAFLAGLAVAAYPANVHFRPAVRTARDFFTPLFFVTLGAILPLPRFGDLPLVLGLLAVLLVVKPITLGLLALRGSFTKRASAEAGGLAAQGSEFALVLGLAGVLTGDLTFQQFGTLGIPIAVSMLFTSPTPRRIVDALERVLPERTPPPPVRREGHVVVLGVGVTGNHLLRALRDRGESPVAVDVDPAALAEVPRDVDTFHGDATVLPVLHAASLTEARAVVCLVKTDRATLQVMGRVLEVAEPMQPRPLLIARVHGEGVREILERRGVRVVRRADEMAQALHHMLAKDGHLPNHGRNGDA